MTYGMKRVRPKRVRRLNRLWLYLSVFGGTVFLVLFVSAQSFVFSLESEIRELRNRQRDIQVVIATLEEDVARLRKGSRIKQIAQDQLKLKMPEGVPEKLF